MDAPALLEQHGGAPRVTIEAGDFFEAGVADGDAHVLSHINHDRNDEQCLTILANCRKAIKPHGRLPIVEKVLPAGDTPHLGKVLDIVVLVVPAGQECRKAEYERLLDKTSFRLAGVMPTESAVSVVEAVVAEQSSRA